MATITDGRRDFHPEQREDLAKRLGFSDPWSMTLEDVTERTGQIRNRAERAERSYADSDPTGILRLTEMPAAKPVTRTTATTDSRAILLPHKARGAITQDDYADWERRLRTAFLPKRLVRLARRCSSRTGRLSSNSSRSRTRGDELRSVVAGSRS